MILCVIFVVLMLFWLFGGGYAVYNGPAPNPVVFGTNTLIPGSALPFWDGFCSMGFRSFST